MPGEGTVRLRAIHKEEDVSRLHRNLRDRSHVVLEIADTLRHAILRLVAAAHTSEPTLTGVGICQVPGDGHTADVEVSILMLVTDAGLVRVARPVLGSALRSFDRADELGAVVESESDSTHHVQARNDLGMSEHLAEGFAVRLFELKDVDAPQTEPSRATEGGVVVSSCAGLDLVFVVIECIVGRLELLSC